MGARPLKSGPASLLAVGQDGGVTLGPAGRQLLDGVAREVPDGVLGEQGQVLLEVGRGVGQQRHPADEVADLGFVRGRPVVSVHVLCLPWSTPGRQAIRSTPGRGKGGAG